MKILESVRDKISAEQAAAEETYQLLVRDLADASESHNGKQLVVDEDRIRQTLTRVGRSVDDLQVDVDAELRDRQLLQRVAQRDDLREQYAEVLRQRDQVKAAYDAARKTYFDEIDVLARQESALTSQIFAADESLRQLDRPSDAERALEARIGQVVAAVSQSEAMARSSRRHQTLQAHAARQKAQLDALTGERDRLADARRSMLLAAARGE